MGGGIVGGAGHIDRAASPPPRGFLINLHSNEFKP